MMKRNFLKILLGFILTLTILILPTKVSADSINYQCLKYGTSEQSIASGYYVKPAQISANGDQYLVTMTIQTGAKLGNWPVTVLSINGAGPANVSKTRNGDNYDYSYSFQTKDLSKVINSSISINVPNVYTAKHNIGFKFDTGNLPALAATNSSNSSSQASASSTSNASSVANSSSVKKDKSKTTTKNNSSANKQIAALNKKNKQTQTAIIIVGISALVILAVAAFFFIKRK